MTIRRWIALWLLAFSIPVLAEDRVPGFVDRLEVVSTYDAYGGQSFGSVGPYEVIAGIVHGKLDPRHPANAGIVDIALAPRGADGMVSYSEDFVILRPKNPSGPQVLFYDVVNRGNKVASGTFNGASGNFTTGSPGNALLMRLGYTVVWSGWQGNIAQTGHGDTASVGTSFPSAVNPDGSAITGASREEYVLDALTAQGPGYNASTGMATVTLTYPPANLGDRNVTFNWRQSWRTADGSMTFSVPSTPVPASNWSYSPDGTQLIFKPATGADLGSIYEFIYQAKNPTVMGLGFAAVRDLVSFLRYERADHQGNANPVALGKTCARGNDRCRPGQALNFDAAVMEGVSQSGRFTKDFLWQGFNEIRGQRVFDGMMPIISASRKTYTNFRWGQPGRWSKEHEDHFQPGDQFPFTYNVIRDPHSEREDGLLKRCLQSDTCPKIVHLDGGFEFGGGRSVLVSTDGLGHDVRVPDNVRLFVVPGVSHGGGAGIEFPGQSAICQYPSSPVLESTIDRALVPVLVDWVLNGTEPPASQWPSMAHGDLAAPADQRAVGFPDLSALGIPWGGALYNRLYKTDYTDAVPVAELDAPYTVLISRTNSDGIELAGVRVPEAVVPLGTYASWNIRAAGHAQGEACYANGGLFAFAPDAATRKSRGDPRLSLAERYPGGKAQFVAQVQAAAQALVAQRLLLPEDVAVYVGQAQAQTLVP